MLNINPQRTIDAFRELGMNKLIDQSGLTYSHEVFFRMERGQLEPEEFRDEIRSLLDHTVSDEAIDAAWTAMILDFPARRVELLQELKNRFNTYLFSNTNAIHVHKFESDFRKQHRMELQSVFRQNFYSNEIGHRKPAIEAFQHIIQAGRLTPEETLFIDDSSENTRGAEQTGLRAYWLQPGEKVEELFARMF